MTEYDYGSAINAAFTYLLDNYPEVFVMGQGLWSPWYVGNTMEKLEIKYGVERVIDTPVSESACTGAAVGAGLCGMRPIIVHPRMDFMLYAMDSIINQAAKWSHMFGGQARSSVTIRGIINRGGEQGAQHSQALHSFFAHIPGLRVVMPYTVADARDLLISSVLCDDPVVFIDDRWLYEEKSVLPPVKEEALENITPSLLRCGEDITIIGSGYSCLLAEKAAAELQSHNIQAEVINMRVLSPINDQLLLKSVAKTGRLLIIDGGWRSCGFSAELITRAVEKSLPGTLVASPKRITLPDAPAPTASNLEAIYYPSTEIVVNSAKAMISGK